MRRKLAPAVTGEARATHCISYDRRSFPHTLALSHCFDSGSVSYYVGSCIVRADATGQPLDKIEEDTDRDFFMTPEEAMEYGIIDEVRSSFPLFACVEALAHTPLLERYVCDVARMVGELWCWMPKFRRVRRQLVYSQALASQHSIGVSRCHFAASLPLRTHFPWQF